MLNHSDKYFLASFYLGYTENECVFDAIVKNNLQGCLKLRYLKKKAERAVSALNKEIKELKDGKTT